MALINCRECNREISSEAKRCPHCGCKTKEKKQFKLKKWQMIVGSLVAVVLVIVIACVIQANAWKGVLSVKYVGYDLGVGSEYEITNKSQKTLDSVHAIIHVDSVYGDFKFEDYVTSYMHAGEIVEYTLRSSDVKSACRERGIDAEQFAYTKAEIVGFKWE